VLYDCLLLAWFEVPSISNDQTISIFCAASHDDVSIAETCPAFVTLTSLATWHKKMKWFGRLKLNAPQTKHTQAASKQA
jgi:hypothetical protein